ncbi:MAG: nucleotide sugar dehydrogenase [Nitrososphaeria archaeon]|nr:nucleotide sugar dehydrogenase [Nitrososphaeria archaeon]NDB51704.1 nucleotide sugar dehydrogenase [Nitrosopumilaceae archaeon]NDB88496.1 nucleotide sugar dehydrogenase [Nitrososphaerota archaeon]NDB46680.1 nucleotide sugar dehydrogenase [Nitrososphaeria archaeon]NDB90375.1 nucleotide sugar dehydrogenase [Nitrososphaerota archaeon]
MNLNQKFKTIDDFKKSLQTHTLHVSVIGIGRIGLPTALSFADSGLHTTGIDINTNLVKMINSGDFPLKDEPGYDVIFNKVNNKQFFATADIKAALEQTDIVLLSLPTPMDNANVPDYTALKSVAKQLHDLMKEGTLVIVESTVEPSFVETDLIPIIEGTDKKFVVDKNFLIGVCPETANPGEILKDFKKLPRLVGATSEMTTSIIMDLYHHVFPVDLLKMPDCKSANAVKLTTNVFRDVNIAFINELSLLFEKLGIDTFKVLEAAKTKYNFQIHYPGAGVGGPCLPVNSYQMLNIAKKYTNDFKIVRISRQVNEYMPDHVMDLIEDGFTNAQKSLQGSTIVVLGISYKPNVKDVQLSPAEKIIEKLTYRKAIVKVYDPYYKSEKVFGLTVDDDLSTAVTQADAMVLVTAHDEFRDIELSFLVSKMKKTPVIVDSRGVMDDHAAKKAGAIFRGLGRVIS